MKVSSRTRTLVALLLFAPVARASDKLKAPDFGPNVAIFSPSTSAAEIQAKIDEVYAVQQHNQCGKERNALLQRHRWRR